MTTKDYWGIGIALIIALIAYDKIIKPLFEKKQDAAATQA
jgi:hypothetical protein